MSAFGLVRKRLFVPYVYQRPQYTILVTPVGWFRIRRPAFEVDVCLCIALLATLLVISLIVRVIYKVCARGACGVALAITPRSRLLLARAGMAPLVYGSSSYGSSYGSSSSSSSSSSSRGR